MEPKNIFEDAEIIHSYTRAQAIEDGVLVDLTETFKAEIHEAGFKGLPVAMTARAYAECVALTPKAKEAGNDVHGRAWDVLYMLMNALRRGARGNPINYELYVVRDRLRPTRTTLKAVFAPGDNGEPTLTVMFSDED